MKRARALLAVATLCTLPLACGGAAAEGAGPASPTSGSAASGGQAPDFATRDIQGKTVKLSDYLGKQAVLMDFWSTYCEPCLAEMPHLRALYEKYRARGFVVLAIAMDGPETVASVPSFAKRNQMTFPVLLDEDSRIASLYDPKKSAPYSVLIDKSGKIAHAHEGYNPGDEVQLEEHVARVLDLAPPSR